MAWEAGRDGVLVNVVAPGFTLTDSRPPIPSFITDKLAAGTPTRRLSDSDDVAQLVLFLGSGANGNLAGEVIRDGSSAARSPRWPLTRHSSGLLAHPRRGICRRRIGRALECRLSLWCALAERRA
ncbi:SDR family oxidoreductase [Streptomyces sp. NPDC005989]|uniref:SDR family oxidoreductase n=1 Tax=Streptomyces sp. NPDC005989 TaxID=3156727 RepID=UPI0033D27169